MCRLVESFGTIENTSMTKKEIKKPAIQPKNTKTRADIVREKLAAKEISVADVADAIVWARKKNSPR